MGLPPDVSQPAGLLWVDKQLGDASCEFSLISVCFATIILQPLLLTKRNKYAKIYS